MRLHVATDLIDRYCWAVDQVHGVYLDATMAMGELARGYMQYEANLRSQLQHDEQVSPERVDPAVVYTGEVRGKKSDLHMTRLSDLIHRNGPEGNNWIFLAQMCVVAVYQFWEDHYRSRLASVLGKAPNDLRAEVLGELRHHRRSVIHNGGYAVPEVGNLNVLRSFRPGELITLEPQDIHDLTDEVKSAVRSFLPRPESQA